MTIFVAICGVLGTLFSLYYLFASFFGLLLKKRVPTSQQPPRSRIAAVVAARNEAAVIGALVRSLLEQDYPRELFDVYVVPNNCTDDTEAAALAAGAKVLRVDGPIRSKGEALGGAFSQLSAMGGYDAYCVFDADNLVDKGFLRAVNDALASGCHVAQGFRDSKNPYDSWVAGGMAAFFWFLSRFYNESRSRLGLSCHLNGTGYMVSDEAIRAIGWNTHTLTEDVEFTAQCALKGFKVGWMPDARIYDEQSPSFRVSCTQRRRWTAGSLQCMRRYVGRLLAKRTMPAFDMLMLLLGNLMFVIGPVPGVVSAVRVAPLLAHHPGRILALALCGAAYYLACCGCAALLYHAEGRLNRRALPGVFAFPVFLVSWLPINVVACLTPPPRWKEIRHERVIDRPDNGERQAS